ncbi:MAG: sialate O-acetylesterase [Pseudomonadota bacterium]
MTIAHFLVAGQSNVDQWFHADSGSTLTAFKTKYMALNPGVTDVILYDVARGGSALLKSSAFGYANDQSAPGESNYDTYLNNYWWDEDNDVMGYTFDLFDHRITDWVNDDGIVFDGILWAQGEADTTYVGAANIATYQATLARVFEELMALSNCNSVYVQALGDRSAYSPVLHAGTELIRQAQFAVAAADARVTVASTIFDLDLRDSVHLTDAAYHIAAERLALAISTGEKSPNITAQGRAADRIFLQFGLNVGQSMATAPTPAGFRVSDASGSAQVQSVVVEANGFVTLTLNRPVADATVSYGLAEVSSDLVAGDYLTVDGAMTLPVHPFSVTAQAEALLPEGFDDATTIRGTAFADDLQGDFANERLLGLGGNDRITGGAGSDRLYGGAGADTFVFAAGSGVEVIYDFNMDEDWIELQGIAKTELTAKQIGVREYEFRSPYGDRLVVRNVPLEVVFRINEGS